MNEFILRQWASAMWDVYWRHTGDTVVTVAWAGVLVLVVVMFFCGMAQRR